MKCKSDVAVALEKNITFEDKIKNIEECTIQDSKLKVTIVSILIGSIVSYIIMRHLTRAKKTQNTYFMSSVIFIGIFGSFFVSTYTSYNVYMQILKKHKTNMLKKLVNDIEVYRKLNMEEHEILKQINSEQNYFNMEYVVLFISMIILFVMYSRTNISVA